VERFIRARRKSRLPVPPPSLPFALVERGAKGLRLAAVNAAAREFGLMRGQRLADARAAVPDLLSEAHEPEQDTASLLGLCRWMERYSPWVAPDPPDGLLMEITGIPHLFGGEAAMIAGMRARLAGYGFTARLACAGTIGAAWALARYGRDGEDSLQGLPVEALRIDADAARTLRRLGLKSIGALAGLPRASLARRFRGESIHENVLLRLDELMGTRPEPLNAINPETSVMAHRGFMEPVITHERLATVLRLLCGEVARALDVKGEGALRLILKLFRSDGGRVQVPVGLTAPSQDGGHLFRLLSPRLETLDAGFGIDAMTLEVREAGAAVARQYGFMEEGGAGGIAGEIAGEIAGGDDTSLVQLNDRVMTRQEREITRHAAVASHIPEHSEEVRPLGKGVPSVMPGTGQLRPLMIFVPPQPARVIAAVPDGPPMSLTWRRVTRRILRHAGPERIAPEWWRGDAGTRPRDYYMIEDEQGRRYWIYREGLYGEEGGPPPKWFVHGLSA